MTSGARINVIVQAEAYGQALASVLIVQQIFRNAQIPTTYLQCPQGRATVVANEQLGLVIGFAKRTGNIAIVKLPPGARCIGKEKIVRASEQPLPQWEFETDLKLRFDPVVFSVGQARATVDSSGRRL